MARTPPPLLPRSAGIVCHSNLMMMMGRQRQRQRQYQHDYHHGHRMHTKRLQDDDNDGLPRLLCRSGTISTAVVAISTSSDPATAEFSFLEEVVEEGGDNSSWKRLSTRQYPLASQLMDDRYPDPHNKNNPPSSASNLSVFIVGGIIPENEELVHGKAQKDKIQNDGEGHDIVEKQDTAATTSEFDDTASSFWEDELSVRSFQMDIQHLACEDPYKAADALEIMREMYAAAPDHAGTVQPDISCYHAVMEAWIHVGQPDRAFDMLQQLRDEQQQKHNDINNGLDVSGSIPPIVPTGWTYELVIHGYLEQSLQQQQQQQYDGDCHSNDVASVALHTIQRAELVLRQMQHAASHNLQTQQQLSKLWLHVLAGWCKRAAITPLEAMQGAEQILLEREQVWNKIQKQNNKNGAINLTDITATATNDDDDGGTTGTTVQLGQFYTTYVTGLSRSKQHDLARRAEAVLDRMERHGISPGTATYNAVLNAWSKATSRRERDMAATRVIRLLADIENMWRNSSKKKSTSKACRRSGLAEQPNLITYGTAITAIGNSLDPAAPQLAEQVLRRMYQLYEADNSSSKMWAAVKPVTATFNCLIYAVSRAAGLRGDGGVRHAHRAELLLDEMRHRAVERGEIDVAPDVKSYASVLRAWAQCGDQPDAAERAQLVLDTWEEQVRQHQQQQQQVDGVDKSNDIVRPNYVCYSTVIQAWGQSPRKDALDKMEALLQLMESTFEQTLDPEIRPNIVTYVIALDAIIRRNHPNAAERAQAIVDRMLILYAKGLGHVRPNRLIFNTLIHAWSKSKHPSAAKRAESIFQWMERQRNDPDVCPDAVSLCAVLNAWASHTQDRALSAARARQIWEHAASVLDQERGFPLTVAMTNIVIKAIARSRDPDAPTKAEQMLLQAERDYGSGKRRSSGVRPDVKTYASVMNACAYVNSRDPEKRQVAMDIAIRTFDKICSRSDIQPNNVVYGTMFKAVAYLMRTTDDDRVSAKRDSLVRKLFDQCCEHGQVDTFVLRQVRHASPTVYRELVEDANDLPSYVVDDHDDDNDDNEQDSVECILQSFPPEWSANVVAT